MKHALTNGMSDWNQFVKTGQVDLTGKMVLLEYLNVCEDFSSLQMKVFFSHS